MMFQKKCLSLSSKKKWSFDATTEILGKTMLRIVMQLTYYIVEISSNSKELNHFKELALQLILHQ